MHLERAYCVWSILWLYSACDLTYVHTYIRTYNAYICTDAWTPVEVVSYIHVCRTINTKKRNYSGSDVHDGSM